MEHSLFFVFGLVCERLELIFRNYCKLEETPSWILDRKTDINAKTSESQIFSKLVSTILSKLTSCI